MTAQTVHVTADLVDLLGVPLSREVRVSFRVPRGSGTYGGVIGAGDQTFLFPSRHKVTAADNWHLDVTVPKSDQGGNPVTFSLIAEIETYTASGRVFLTCGPFEPTTDIDLSTVPDLVHGTTGVVTVGGPKGDKGDPTTIVEGAGISVDDTDPANPIVSATFGGTYGELTGKPSIPSTPADIGAASAAALTAETSRATTAEGVNATAISAETTRASAAESTLTTSVAGKVAATRQVNGHALSADVTVTKADVGLGSADNTSDAGKPISTATATALAAKADLVAGTVPDAQIPAAIARDTEVTAAIAAQAVVDSATYAALTKRVVKTANYTAQANDLVACDTTSGTFTVTIPAASGGKARIGVKWIAGTVAPSIVLSGTDKFNITGGVTSATPSLLNQGYVIESDGTSIWTVVADDLPLSQLDGRFASLPSSGQNRLTGWYHADGYGVDLTGATDSTTALGNWISAIPAGGTGYLPPGTVKATAALPQPATGVVLRGAGESSIITFAPASANATMMSLSSGQQRVRFQDMQFSFAAGGNSATGRLFTLNNVFRNSWTRCRIQGQHTAAADSYAVTTGHVGVAIIGNAGDNLFYDCDFLNLGVGIMTDSIQNGVIGGKFGTCYVGILGTTNIDGDGQANSGMSLVGHIDFVSASTAGLVKNNIWIDGAANQWWLTNVWFEGADVPILVGDTSGNGPTQFGIVNAKVASTTAGIHLQSCRQPYLANIQFSANGAATPTPLIVDAARVNEGVASNLINVISGLGTDPFAAALPNGVGNSPGWIYLGRTSVYLPNNTYLRSGSSLRFTRSDGATAGQVSLSGSSVQLLGVQSSSVTALFKFGDNASKSILELDNISSGANAIGIANAVTGNSPTVDARGTDTNVSLTLKAKGTGQVIATSPVVFPNYTTTARNALAGVVAGSTVYDTTLHKLVTYDGTGWRDQSATSV